ncbi:sodium- and chloride-dependent betaine transporter-like [Watersipora subatra]|uniref:sodium- and chloride-dependent betaine transporter-like n=1 Tax=Watersipora subatra TaxID=2589382 RepID=UPI00355C3969
MSFDSKNNVAGCSGAITVESSSDNSSSSNGSKSKRATWGNSIEFFLSTLGYAVGYGNLWRFPYLCYRNGGGAFLIPYCLFLFLAGIPMVFLEMSLGQYSGAAVFGCWKFCPIMKGVGMGMVMVSTYWGMYYNVIIMWTLYYLYYSFSKVLPWADCGNEWNTPECLPLGIVGNTSLCNSTNMTTESGSSIDCNARAPYPAEEFWDRKVLTRSEGITELGVLKWDLALLLVISWLIIFLCLLKGIKTSGKVVYVTATAPYILITILMVQGATREGSLDGVIYYIKPTFARLGDPRVWAEACSQIFYSVAPGWGGLITMASYNKFNTNIYRYSLGVPLLNCATSFYNGFVIFSVLGYMARMAGVKVEEVVNSGPGLMFVAYPYALSQMPLPQLWCVLFFIMILAVGLDSQFASIETFTTSVADEFPHIFTSHRRKVIFTGLICLTLCLIGFFCCTHAGIYIFQLLDWYVAVFSTLFISILEAVAVAWVYGAERMMSDIKVMIGYRPHVIWVYMWRFVTPLTVTAMLFYSLAMYRAPVYNGVIEYPPVAIGLCWVYALSATFPIFGYAIYLVFYRSRQEPLSIVQRFVKYTQPTPEWGSQKHQRIVMDGPSIESDVDAVTLMNVSTTEGTTVMDSASSDEKIV